MTGRPRRSIGLVTALALALLAGAYTYHYLHWNFDDAHIIFRIVRNLLSGHGWAFNVGETHNASTSVLNTVIVALAAKLFSSDVPFTAHILATVWLSITAMGFAWVFGRRFDHWVALAVGVGLIVTLAESSFWGLEVHLFFALFALFVACEQLGRNSWACIGLLTLTRPDGVGLAAIRLLAEARTGIVHAWRTHRRGLLVFAVVLGPWLMFSLARFHHVFPDTLSNKMWQGRSGYWGTGPVYLKALLSYGWHATPFRAIGYVLALPGVVFLARDRSVLLYVIVFALLQQTAYVVLNVPGYHWYFATLDVASVLAAFYAIGCIYEKVVATSPRSVPPYVAAAFYAGMLLFAGVKARVALADQSRDPGDVSYQSTIARLKADGIPSGPIAMVEVGTFGYYLPDHAIIDMLGLASANPEYVTGGHNDQFFSAPASTVLFHSPLWPLEHRLHDDVRFRMLYEGPMVVSDTIPMQYFVLKPRAHATTRGNQPANVGKQYLQ